MSFLIFLGGVNSEIVRAQNRQHSLQGAMMKRKRVVGILSILIATYCLHSSNLSRSILAQDQIPTKEGVQQRFDHPHFSPYAGRSYPTKVLWGDTHLHTAVSVDAGTMCRLGQEDAYRFARGEEVTSTGGLRAKLSRPLDFVVISDHAEMYGLMPQLLSGDPEILATEKGKRWHRMITTGDRDQIFNAAMEIIGTLKDKNPPIAE